MTKAPGRLLGRLETLARHLTVGATYHSEEVLVRPAGGAHPVVCVGPNAPV